MFFRVHTRFVKDTYLFPSVYHRLGWIFRISRVLVQFSLSFICKDRGFIVDKLYVIFCNLNVSVVIDSNILMLRFN
jgi:hypothetical protein